MDNLHTVSWAVSGATVAQSNSENTENHEKHHNLNTAKKIRGSTVLYVFPCFPKGQVLKLFPGLESLLDV